MSGVIDYLDRQPGSLLLLLSLLFVALIGVLDYASGAELASSVFYVLPIFTAAWFINARGGMLLATLSAAVWLLSDALAKGSYSHPVIPLWNGLVLLALFQILAHMFSALRMAERKRDELTKFIVHDLRSPLGGILVAVQAFEQIGETKLDPDHADLVDTIDRSGQRMLTLVNSILDLSRLERGKMPLQRAQLDLEDIVAYSISQVAMLAAQKRVTIRSELDRGALRVWADRELTLRILVNLLSNALKYAPENSAVTVRAALADTAHTVLSVCDEGPGIPKRYTRKVFNKFVQVQAREAGASVGSGLGLSFCRLAVEAQGGRVWLESEEGQGTTVLFTLPSGPEGKPSGTDLQ